MITTRPLGRFRIANPRRTQARVIGGQLDPSSLRIVNRMIEAGGQYAGWRNNVHYVKGPVRTKAGS